MDGGFVDLDRSSVDKVDKISNRSIILPAAVNTGARRFSRGDSVPKKIVEH